MKNDLNKLRAEGQTPRPERQVGAWQSMKITPYSKLVDLLMVAQARTTPLSTQHKQLFEELKKMIQDYNSSVAGFMNDQWKTFEQNIKKSDLQWSEEWN